MQQLRTSLPHAANASPFGLAASVWSTDQSEIDTLHGALEFGAVFANGNTASFFGLPFGGVKQSGYGRELTELGMHAFMNAKTVWVGPPSSEQSEGDTAGSAAE